MSSKLPPQPNKKIKQPPSSFEPPELKVRQTLPQKSLKTKKPPPPPSQPLYQPLHKRNQPSRSSNAETSNDLAAKSPKVKLFSPILNTPTTPAYSPYVPMQFKAGEERLAKEEKLAVLAHHIEVRFKFVAC